MKREHTRNQHKVEDEGGVGPLNPNLLKKTTQGQVSSKDRLITENYPASKENNVLLEIFQWPNIKFNMSFLVTEQFLTMNFKDVGGSSLLVFQRSFVHNGRRYRLLHLLGVTGRQPSLGLLDVSMDGHAFPCSHRDLPVQKSSREVRGLCYLY